MLEKEEKIIADISWIRLDKFLVDKFSYSRNFFHNIISRWSVLVNWVLAKKSLKIKIWDVIEINDFKRFLSSEIASDFWYIDLNILLDKEDYLVLYKPKWVLSHPSSIRDLSTPSVVWFLINKYKDLPTYSDFIRAWLIHRLDKDTDGPMIIAKTEMWLKYFKELFQSKSTENTIEWKEAINLRKIYEATVFISDKWKNFFLEQEKPFYIQQDVIPKTPNSVKKFWISKIISVYDMKGFYNIEIEILTWRTHQIRYHLFSNGAFILWDFLYWNMKSEMDLQLSCKKLIFRDCYWDDIEIINPNYL